MNFDEKAFKRVLVDFASNPQKLQLLREAEEQGFAASAEKLDWRNIFLLPEAPSTEDLAALADKLPSVFRRNQRIESTRFVAAVFQELVSSGQWNDPALWQSLTPPTDGNQSSFASAAPAPSSGLTPVTDTTADADDMWSSAPQASATADPFAGLDVAGNNTSSFGSFAESSFGSASGGTATGSSFDDVDWSTPPSFGDAAFTQAGGATSDLEAKKNKLLAEADNAVLFGQLAEAEALYRQVLALDENDSVVRDRLALLPPAPPQNIDVTIDDSQVLLNWEYPTDDPDVRFTVVAASSAIDYGGPGNTVVKDSSARSAVVPLSAALAHPFFRVFAVRSGQTPSAAGEYRTVTVPAARDFTAATSEDSVTLSWASHPLAVKKIVTLTGEDGSEDSLTLAGENTCTFEGLTPGVAYTCAVELFFNVDKTQHSSAPVSVTAIPRPVPKPITDLSIINHADVTGDAEAAVRCTTQPGVPVEVWALPAGYNPTVGARVTRAQLSNAGAIALRVRKLDSSTSPAADADAVSAVSPRLSVLRVSGLPGVCRIVACADDGDNVVVGAPVLAAIVGQVKNVHVDNLATGSRLSWEWPSGDTIVEIRFTDPSGVVQERAITTSRYRNDGGVMIPAGAHTVMLRTAATVDGTTYHSPAQTIIPPAASDAPTQGSVSYTLAIKHRLLKGASVDIAVTSSPPGFTGQLNVLVSSNTYLPTSPQDGRIVATIDVDCASSPTWQTTLDLGKERSPFWVRLFATPGSSIVVNDPPTPQMKG